MGQDRNGLEIMTRAECLRLLASRPIGRVGLTRNALPAIHPVVYTVEGGDVVFATGAGTSHLAPVDDAVIAFEVDDVDLVTRCGWSVLVVGVGRRINLEDAGAGTCLELGPWVSPGAAHVIRLATEHVTGRRQSDPASSATKASGRLGGGED
jgi:uncharacterized protein